MVQKYRISKNGYDLNLMEDTKLKVISGNHFFKALGINLLPTIIFLYFIY